ncbi:hypothetical protein BDP27DRAFT_1357239 [Rhodocollybia butyracea]|uniref:Uncharacterized protein n=1 Tax=Rhodocollybia butyracea TaxID=206335 RepID=A0A9P5Q4B3_9AGAR|nr:hypothetical protein BDP27DRAFT_1357239 [Rhodocollybia butyracea]
MSSSNEYAKLHQWPCFSMYALFFLAVFLMTSLLVFGMDPGQKPCNCINFSDLSNPLLMLKRSKRTPLIQTSSTPISETEIWHEKIQVFCLSFLALVCYNAVFLLLIFRNVCGMISSKIDQGITLLKRHIGNNEYQHPSDQPVGRHRYAQYSGLMRPDSHTWEPNTTFFKDDWPSVAWVVGSIDFVFILFVSIFWVGLAKDIYSEGVNVLVAPVYIMFSILGACGLVLAAFVGTEFTVECLKLDISGTENGNNVAWGLCEEIWMAMGMDAVKLRKLSQMQGKGKAEEVGIL